MVTLSVSAPEEEGFLTMASPVRTLLIVAHDPSQGESFTRRFLSWTKDSHAGRALSR